MKNIFKQAAMRNELFQKRYGEFFRQFCNDTYNQLIAAVKERTPVDYGALRSAFQQDSSAAMTGNVFTMKIRNTAKSKTGNPAMYAAHVEWGYKQKPGMILKMREESGKLRFVAFLGYSYAYGKGDPTGKQQPDKDGNYIIVTRKRDIKGKHMLKDSIDELERELPKRYAERFTQFLGDMPWI